jgi:hypothetical protein
VREAALQAIRRIVYEMELEPSKEKPNGLLKELSPEKYAEQMRRYVKTARHLPAAQQWFIVLADDDAGPNEWCWAAEQLVSADKNSPPAFVIWSVASKPEQRKSKAQLGEPVRNAKSPSVTDLIRKRIEETGDEHYRLALALAAWDPKAALPVLKERTQFYRKAKKPGAMFYHIDARLDSGDTTALDEYAEWIRGVDQKGFDGRDTYVPFGPMWGHAEHPGIRAAADWLFDDPRSPWFRVLATPENGGNRGAWELLGTPLLRLPGFRKVVLKELQNKSGDGNVRAEPNGHMEVDLPELAVEIHTGGGRGDPEIPKKGIEGKFRICDCVAWKIAERITGAPRCELYWPDKKRDAACAACIDFLQRFGDRVDEYGGEIDMKLPQLDKPATREQAARGDAIFSLEGQGEVRTVKLPVHGAYARWVTLKELPYQDRSVDPRTGKVTTTIVYEQKGRVYQAEEVYKDGRWKRYYGFVGPHHVARVPADDLEFLPEPVGEGEQESHDWSTVGTGLQARLNVPPIKIERFDDLPPRLPADADLTFTISLRNSSGLDQASPAPEKVVRLRLLYSPECISKQGALQPSAVRETDWRELTPKPNAGFMAQKGKTLLPAEEMKLATFDLRDWFEIGRPGFYRLQLVPADKSSGKAPRDLSEVRFSVEPKAR